MIEHVIKKLTSTHLAIKKLNSEYIILWMDDMFLSWRWWLNVAILLVPWVLWFIFRKKESTNRLLLAGMFAFFFTAVLDSVGVAFGLWYYTNTPLPYIHTFFLPWDFSMFPVSIMILLQYKRNIHPLFKAIYFAIMSAYVAEPIFVWLKVYVPLNWKYSYGLPLYFLIYLLAHRISMRKNFEPLD